MTVAHLDRLTCPLCDGPSQAALVTRDHNRRVTGERFEYRRCLSCLTLFLRDPPSDLAPYYPSSYYELPDGDRLVRLSQHERFKLGFVQPWVTAGRLLDIGPGAGAFASLARQAGYQTAVIEMDERTCEHLERVVGIETIRSDHPAAALAELPPSRVITLWHVLEHLPNPGDTLQAAAGNLEPGGILVVAMPNLEAFGLRVLGSRWPHLDAPRHLQLVPWRALEQRARTVGLVTVRLSASDAGARGWNQFGWRYAWTTVDVRGLARVVGYVFGRATTAVLAPVERRGFRGSAYTVVFRKPT